MNMDNKKYLKDEELKDVAGGVYTTPDEFPVGTKVLQNEFNQAVGQYSGEVVAVSHNSNGEPVYDVQWMRGNSQYIQTDCTHSQVNSWHMCWDLSFG